jgi:predicted DNA-binding antitoxin AbrB/MazE fold protein
MYKISTAANADNKGFLKRFFHFVSFVTFCKKIGAKMKIQAIYEDGVLRPTEPLHLKRKLITIYVRDEEVADQALQAEPPKPLPKIDPLVRQRADELLRRLANIHEKVLALPEDQLPKVTEKQLERIEAMEMREER